MHIEQTVLKDCFIVHDRLHHDDRGYFFESFNQRKFTNESGLDITFVQDNQSKSSRGVLRGLHFQTGEAAQAKLVRVVKGEVLDVAVDLRKSSPTFGQYISVHLSETSNTQMFIPRGFAHGFVVLSEEAIFFYKCDNYYSKPHEGGLIYNDPTLNIDWQMNPEEILVSSKDMELPLFDPNKPLF